MQVAIVGAGYVGLVSGACLADGDHDVVCVDVDRSKVEAINAGRPTIYEPGLPELLARTAGRSLRATVDLDSAVRECEIVLIAVGTPARDGKIDISFVRDAARRIGAALAHSRSYVTVVVKSTVIPGTTDGIVRQELESASGRQAGAGFGLGMNPEFLTEGRAVEDFTNPDRIVIGGRDARTHDALLRLYSRFEHVPKMLTNNTTAEFIKYASNAALATAISFANEISRLCRAVGDADVVDVMRGVHASLYFTTRLPDREPVVAGIASFFEAGCGFGGSCLPKDVTALIGQGRELGLELPLLSAVLAVNQTQSEELLQLVRRHFPDLRGVRTTVLGIAFKPDTDDVRESPAFPVIDRLRAAGAAIVAYDPVARPAGHPALQGVSLAGSLEEAVGDAQVVVLVTRWREFERLADVLDRLGKQPLVVDGRRVLDPARFQRYEGIGRAASAAGAVRR
ncbi:MAG: UDP-glucose/GDP-mannose dehydrogenase family protein [Steroidobacteraceae bacterium]|nr:UDP-glucose/GDP-mannose dehydrogenase family protein [Steroidobacteraceae bacterium]MDW8260867.1 UDP-glucose/GDP-mannose dehydrogenase family protein [Gammaproteobacteria bacterium]